MNSNDLFNNTQVAFALKSNKELGRAYFLFRLIASPFFVKVTTSLVSFLLKIKMPIGYFIRITVFEHFCGGVDEKKSVKVVDKLYTKKVYSILDYSVEGKVEEAQFDKTLEMTIKTIHIAKDNEAIPFAVFKPTGLGRELLFEKIGNNHKFTPVEEEEWKRLKNRFIKVCGEAYKCNVPILIDAEYFSTQKGIDDLVEELMQMYNKESAVVFNTLQMYRWDRMDYLKNLHAKANKDGFYIGLKLVRGAYLENEIRIAKENNYPSPICKSKEETDAFYNAAVEYMIENINKMSVFIGTHNEESCYNAMQIMKMKNLKNNDKRIWFSQLYGMSDNITFNLATEGYNAAKYLPFGPIVDVMPYLIRRAEENTSVSKQTGRELSLITAERKRRRIK